MNKKQLVVVYIILFLMGGCQTTKISKGESNISKPPEGLIVCPPEVHEISLEEALKNKNFKNE